MAVPGRRTWVIPGGHVPPESSGEEPRWTSHDRLAVLNANDEAVELELTIYHAEREPVGPYRLELDPRRVREVRVNDLVDPEAVPLDQPYALVISASGPVVVQFSRQDTGQPSNSQSTTIAYSE